MRLSSGIVMIVGSVLFLIAAFTPISARVFPESDLQKRIAAIRDDAGGWLIANLLFGAGALVTALGLGLFTAHVQTISPEPIVGACMILSVVAAAVGAVLWAIIVYQRATLPPEALFGNTNVSDWIFPTYTVLTQIALILLGCVLLRTGYPSWLGYGLIGLAVLLLVGFIILKDMPPFVHYFLLLVVGMVVAR